MNPIYLCAFAFIVCHQVNSLPIPAPKRSFVRTHSSLEKRAPIFFIPIIIAAKAVAIKAAAIAAAKAVAAKALIAAKAVAAKAASTAKITATKMAAMKSVAASKASAAKIAATAKGSTVTLGKTSTLQTMKASLAKAGAMAKPVLKSKSFLFGTALTVGAAGTQGLTMAMAPKKPDLSAAGLPPTGGGANPLAQPPSTAPASSSNLVASDVKSHMMSAAV